MATETQRHREDNSLLIVFLCVSVPLRRTSFPYLDCFLIVMSKFFTIDLYIPHTIAEYAATAPQPNTNSTTRFRSQFSGSLYASSAYFIGFSSTVISVKGLKLPRTSPITSSCRLETTLNPQNPSPKHAPTAIPSLLI